GERGRDLAALRRNPALAGAEILPLPDGAALRLPGPAAATLARDPLSWLQPPGEAPAPAALGFAVQATPHGVALSLAPGRGPQPAEAAPPLLAPLATLAGLPKAALLAHWRALPARLAATPAAERGPLRLALAETLLALGLGAEAQAAVQLATAEDPRLAAQPRALLLAGAAALLAGRLAEADAALDDPRLLASPETALWRGLSKMETDGDIATEGFRAATPLLLRYPAPLRARLLPKLAAGLAEAGAKEEAAALLAGDEAAAALPLARHAAGLLQEAAGATTAAIETQATLATGRDRDARARALARLAELRLAAGSIDAAGAAEAMERAIPAWRGDRREVARRLRAAELRLLAQQPAAALALLQDTVAAFPEEAGTLRPKLLAATLAVVADPASDPVAMARLVAAQPTPLPPDAALDAALARIADRLAGLELPQEAVAMLKKALPNSTGSGNLAVRLAEAQLADGDAEGALQTLSSGSGGAALPGEIGRRRALAEAAARQQLGDTAGAAGVLRALGPEGAGKLAEMLASAQDWAGAAAALRAHLELAAPGDAALDAPARRDLLRLAAFLALAQDQEGLAAVQQRYAPRVPAGTFADAFAALADGTPGTLDLPRLRQEIAGTRALQEQLRALR
ncbi:hypothetical protein, partial [Falsiroseomonas selenitidurans]